MSEKKTPIEGAASSKKTELAVTKKKPTAISKPPKKSSVLAQTTPSDLYRAFDNTFERFRDDFEDLFFPFGSRIEREIMRRHTN